MKTNSPTLNWVSKKALVGVIFLLLLYQFLLLHHFATLTGETHVEMDFVHPKMWKTINTTGNLTIDLTNLALEYLRPWRHITNHPRKIVSNQMYDDMEQEHYGYGIRVRVVNGEVYYRHFYELPTDQLPFKLGYHLHFIKAACEKDTIPNVEFFLGLTEGPKSVADSSSGMGGLPIFSPKTSKTYLDIAIPDASEFGKIFSWLIINSRSYR
jgi:hypothetical protein